MRDKRVVAVVAVLIAFGGVASLMYWRLNRLSTAALTGVADSGTLAIPSVFTDAALMPRSAPPGAPTANPFDAAVPRASSYAVVRDGICVPSNVPDQEEASRKKWEALLRDPFWQSIFSGVNPEKFYVVKTSFPLRRYVTYWKMKNRQLIHWTGKEILIPSGTRVFTDGRGDMFLCACGNQVAAVLPPRMATTVLPPEEEPPVAYLVPSEPEPFPVVPKPLVGETPMPPPELAAVPPFTNAGSIPPIPPILPPPIFIGGSPPPGSEPGPGPTPVPPNVPPVVPEPNTLSLTLIGVGGFILVCRHRMRR